MDMKWGSRLQYNLLAQTNQYSFTINPSSLSTVNKAVSLVPHIFSCDRNTLLQLSHTSQSKTSTVLATHPVTSINYKNKKPKILAYNAKLYVNEQHISQTL